MLSRSMSSLTSNKIGRISNEEFARLINKAQGVQPKKRQQFHEEHEIQTGCVKWFRLQYPKYAKMLYAIPNGSYKSRAAAGMMKAEGLTAGVADLCLAVPRGCYGALYIEMKQKGNYQQANQKEWQKECEDAGNRYVVCRSIEEFMREVNAYMRLGTPLEDIRGAAYNYKVGKMDASVLIDCVMSALKI